MDVHARVGLPIYRCRYLRGPGRADVGDRLPVFADLYIYFWILRQNRTVQTGYQRTVYLWLVSLLVVTAVAGDDVPVVLLIV